MAEGSYVDEMDSSLFLHLPTELIARILSYCSIFDLCSAAMTCKKLRECAESPYVWKKKWTYFSSKSGLSFTCLPSHDVSYKNLCIRLWKVCFRTQSLTACIHCRQSTCLESCLENWERKVVIDIGSKTTRILTPNFNVCRHPTVMAVPKLPPIPSNHYDDCLSPDGEADFDSDRSTGHSYRHTEQLAVDSTCCINLQCLKCKWKLQDPVSFANIGKPVCILCNSKKADQMFSNLKHSRIQFFSRSHSYRDEYYNVPRTDLCDNFSYSVTINPSEEKATGQLDCNVNQPELSARTDSFEKLTEESQQPHYESLDKSQMWQSSVWTDVVGYVLGGLGDWQTISPLDYFVGKANLQTLSLYLEHILGQFKMLYELRKPNVSLILCEPVTSTLEMRKKITTMFFEKLQIARICFLNKALAVARLIDEDTCLVVDSGANNTVVTLIVDGKVKYDRLQHVPIGGTAIARYLAQAIEWNRIMPNVALSSLDDRRVKTNCYLSYNHVNEDKRKSPLKKTIGVRSYSAFSRPSFKLETIELGDELHLAPEMMYTEIGLPEIMKEVVSGLNFDCARDALSHIILTGGNTELHGFATRLMKDLRTLLPDYSSIINVHTNAGSRCLDAVMGAAKIHVPNPCYPDLYVNQPGLPIWITRESYIVYGTDILC